VKARWLARVLGVGAQLAGCHEVVATTQIVIVVDAEPLLRDDIARLELTARRRVEPMEETQVLELDGDTPLPLSFSLVPGIDMLEGTFELRALSAAGELLGSRLLDVTFTPRRTLAYGVLFSDACRAQLGACDAGETCIDCGECGFVLVPPEDFSRLRRAADALSAWAPRLTCDPPDDAGTYDASPGGPDGGPS
jgi:hypothetical protein